MNGSFAVRFSLCVAVAVLALYSYINEQNTLTQLRFELPVLAKQVQAIREENIRLQYEIDLFESPENLMRLAAKTEFAHLKHPSYNHILIVARGSAFNVPSETQKTDSTAKVTLAHAL